MIGQNYYGALDLIVFSLKHVAVSQWNVFRLCV
jgi:hypothetical protein